MADSGQKFIRRNRAPRVHISYDDPYDADQKIELPFVMAVMADLSGDAPGVEKAPVGDRKFLDIDMENFPQRMAAIQPGTRFRVDNKLSDNDEKMGVELQFNSMDDFTPAAVARQVPSLAALLKAREQLSNLMLYMDGKKGAEEQLNQLLKDPALMSALQGKIGGKQAEDGEDKTSAGD